MNEDVAKLVERLLRQAHAERWSTMPPECREGIDVDDAEEAASTIRALAAERDAMERRARAFEAGATKLQARADAAKAKLREAVEVIRGARDAIVRADPTILVDTLWMPMDVSPAETVVDYIDAFLADMEKPNDP